MARSFGRPKRPRMQDPNVREIFGLVAAAIPRKSLLGQNLSNFVPSPDFPCLTGLEIEMENVWDTLDMRYWRIDQDGSLKDHGVELISYALDAEQMTLALEEFKQFLALPKNKKINFTHRCSMHVHLNARELTAKQLIGVVTTYIAVENLLFEMVSPDRQGNTYCFPLADTLVTKEIILKKNNDDFKYSALNFSHLRDYGTLEFRHHNGTKNISEISKWLKVLYSIYNYGSKKPFEDLCKEIYDLNTSSKYRDFIYNVFGPHYILFDDVNIYEKMHDNVTAAKVFLE